MTNQEAFDRAYKHLLTQNKKALTPNHGCAYEAPDGLCCAVGGLLSPGVRAIIVQKGMNGSGAGHLVATCPEAAWELEGVSLELLGALQTCHDSYPVEAWKERLAIVAAWHRLTVPA